MLNEVNAWRGPPFPRLTNEIILGGGLLAKEFCVTFAEKSNEEEKEILSSRLRRTPE